MATAPTFVASYGNTAWSSSTQTASVTVAAGDLIVVAIGTGDSGVQVSTPTGGGLTYTLQQSVVRVTQQSDSYVWTAVSPTAQTFTLTIQGNYIAWVAEVWRNHGGVGASQKKTATATTSLTLSTQGANSALFMSVADYYGISGSSRTYLSSVGTFVEKAYQFAGSGVATFYGGHYADSGAVGSKSVGMSAPSGQHPTLIAVEILAAAPVTPTGSLTIAATTLPNSTPPAVRIDVTDTRSPGQASSLTIMRNNPDGTQVPVRTSDGNPLPLSGGLGTVFDYEMPYGQAVSYAALEAVGITSFQVTVASSQPWLIHTGVPAISTTIDLLPGSLQEETYTVRQGVFYAMGRTNPIVVSDGARKGASSQLVLLAQTASALTALKSIFADASPLLLNPADASWEFGPCYIAISDVKSSRFTDIVIDAYRSVTVTFNVVDRPAGGSQSTRTYADVLAGNSSYAALRSGYSSYAAVLAGP